ncbi:MAG: 30S ribosomal protein S20 [Alphaproteobacteria bacterium]
MANHVSAIKRIRQTKTKTDRNIAWRSRMRTFVRKVEDALKAGDGTAASEAMKNAMPVLHKAAGHGIIHKRTAARKISRLTHKVKLLTGEIA